VKIELAAFFHCYSPKGNAEDRETKIEVYFGVLRAITSPESVVRALKKAQRGNIGEPGFLPSAGEIYQAAQKIHCQLLNERRPRPHQLEHQISDEERTRVGKKLADLAADLMGTDSPAIGDWKPLRPLEAYRDLPQPALSPELRVLMEKSNER
jgi:hypothetical protein